MRATRSRSWSPGWWRMRVATGRGQGFRRRPGSSILASFPFPLSRSGAPRAGADRPRLGAASPADHARHRRRARAAACRRRLSKRAMPWCRRAPPRSGSCRASSPQAGFGIEAIHISGQTLTDDKDMITLADAGRRQLDAHLRCAEGAGAAQVARGRQVRHRAQGLSQPDHRRHRREGAGAALAHRRYDLAGRRAGQPRSALTLPPIPSCRW